MESLQRYLALDGRVIQFLIVFFGLFYHTIKFIFFSHHKSKAGSRCFVFILILLFMKELFYFSNNDVSYNSMMYLSSLLFSVLNYSFLSASYLRDILEKNDVLASKYILLLGFILMMSDGGTIPFLMGICLNCTSIGYLSVALNSNKINWEAGLKFIIFSMICFAATLLSFSILYIKTGFFDPQLLIQNIDKLESNNDVNAIFLLFTFVFSIYFSLVPFQFWLVDSLDGVPTFLAQVINNFFRISVILFFKPLIEILHLLNLQFLIDTLNYLAIFSLVVGHLLALVQTSLKRIIAYSSVANVAMIIFLFNVGESFHSVDANQVLTVSLITYGFILTILYGQILLLENTNKQQIEIYDLIGLSRQSPSIFLPLLSTLIMWASLPLCMLFYYKINSNLRILDFIAYHEVGAICLASLLSIYCYLRLLLLMTKSEKNEDIHLIFKNI